MSRRTRLAWIVAVSVVTGVTAMGGSWWNPLPAFRSMFQKNRTDVLLVCGNYARPRLLAELAQQKTGQPILLIAPTLAGVDDLYLLPSGSDAFMAAKNQFVELAEVIKPKQIVFLGDGEYMAAEYVDALRGRFPSVVLPGDDWNQAAEALAKLLGVGSSLPKRYGELLKVYDEAVMRRPLATAPVAEPEVPAVATAEKAPETVSSEPAEPATAGTVVVPAGAKAPAEAPKPVAPAVEAPAPAPAPAAVKTPDTPAPAVPVTEPAPKLLPPEPKEIPGK